MTGGWGARSVAPAVFRKDGGTPNRDAARLKTRRTTPRPSARDANKRTIVRERLLAIASANPTAAAHELLLLLVNDWALPADARLTAGRRIFRDGPPGSFAQRPKQRPSDSRLKRETLLPGRASTSVANGGLVMLPTLDLLLGMVQDPTDRRRRDARRHWKWRGSFSRRSLGRRSAANFHRTSADFPSIRIWQRNCGMRNYS